MSKYAEDVYRTLLEELQDVPNENIRRYVIPDGFHETTDAPIIRITPLPVYPNTYADNLRLSEEVNLQIDVFWSQREPYQISRVIQALMSMKQYQQVYGESVFDEETFTFREILRYQGYFLEKNQEENTGGI